MTTNKFYIVTLYFLIVSCKPLSIKDIAGTYVNYNFDYEPYVAEIPYTTDTIILNKDLSFNSSFYGKGYFKLVEEKIILNYSYEFGSASLDAPIEIDSVGSPKIILNRDKNHYYKKIK